MILLTLGINHQTAPVDLRERVAFSNEGLSDALRALKSLPSIEEAAILSTCNRTEVYCCSNSPDIDQIIHWLSDYHHLDPAMIKPHLYNYADSETVRHILRVAGGLNSMILGEPQILGQVKQAYQCASGAGTIDSMLSRLFQHTFSVAKQIRTDTAIGESPVSVAFAAVALARQIFSDFGQHTALLIGAGETIELAARHFHEQGLGRIIIANRTLTKARTLAAQFDGYGINLDEIPAHLAEADIVVSSTSSDRFILDQAVVKKAISTRKHRPVFMVDIAVPRDIDPAVAELDDIYLYTVDDLKEVIQENMKSRQQAARQAEEIIDIQVEHFMSWWRGQGAVNHIRLLRTQAETERNLVMEKATQMLAAGKSPEEALTFLAHTLTNKLIHNPSTRLRQAASDNQQELIQAAIELFNLNGKK
ncbi:MAG: glutamyl-tRNA reductase [Gammaproteobacteria bacterium]